MKMPWKKIGRFLATVAITIGLKRAGGKHIERSDIIDAILGAAMDEVVERCPQIRPDVVPALMTSKLLVKFPEFPRDAILRVAIDYCNEDNRLTKKLSQ